MAQLQIRGNYRGRSRSRWGYNKRPETGLRLGPRDQQWNSGRGDNITPGCGNAHAFGVLGKGSDTNNRGIQCFRRHRFGHEALVCRGGHKGQSLKYIMEARDPGEFQKK